MAIKTLLLGVALASVAAGMFSNQRRRNLALGGSGPGRRSGLAGSDRSSGDTLARDLSGDADSGRSTPGLSSGTGMGSGLSGGLGGGGSASGLGSSSSGRSLTGGTPGTNDDLLSPGTSSGVGPTPGGPL